MLVGSRRTLLSPPRAWPGAVNLAGLDRWRTARGAIASISPLVWAVGDSIVKGVGWDGTGNDLSNDNARIYSWPDKLSARLASRYGGVSSGFLQPFADVSDSLVTQSGSTITTSIGLTGVARTLASPNTITYSLPSCTGFDLIYWESDGSNSQPLTGNFKYSVDGGADVTVTYAATVAAYKKVAVSGLSAGTHTVVVTGVTGTTYHCGCSYRSGRSVVVGRVGRPGRTMLDLLGRGKANTVSSAGQIRLLAAFGMGAPSLMILSMGTNDCSQQFEVGFTQTVSDFKANVQSAVDQAITAGASVLLIGEPEPPYASPVSGETYAAYRLALRDVAARTAHCCFIDINAVWGGPTAAIAAGLQNTGSVHPTIAGYTDWSQRLDRFLATV